MSDHPPAVVLETVGAGRADVDLDPGAVDLDVAALEAHDDTEPRAREVVGLLGADLAAEALGGLGLPRRAHR